MKQITKRLIKGTDLKNTVIQTAKEHNVQAGIILCSVGSLSKVNLRMAGAKKTRQWEGDFELINLNGRISQNGEHVHLHLSFSDTEGNVYGGHVLDGCIVRTTVELVILEFEDVVYRSVDDPETGFKELVVEEV